jgi:hypothetical protein
MMKTIIHKLGRTGVAMFRGWLAFVVLLPVIAWGVCLIEGREAGSIPGVWVAFAIYSVPVVWVAWLVIVFPVDCLIPARSRLRRPVPAALLGAVCGGLPFLLMATWDQMDSWESWWREVARLAGDADVWLYQGGAILTGLVAALSLARRFPPGAMK